MGRVQDKVALVTGGAVGIGAAAAQKLAAEGAKVAITDVADAGQAVADELKAAGHDAIFIKQDVTDAAAWETTIAQTVEALGGLDILVNNAGLGAFGNVEDETLEHWRQIQSVNSDAVFLGTQAAIKAMKNSGGGSIVNISSIEGFVGDPNLAAYNASKGAVRSFTKSAALHCAQANYGIRVNSVHPGYVLTPMVQNALEGNDEMMQYLVSKHPIGRMGAPEDIAYAILYLASDESSFVTGSELVIDGGYIAQ